MSDTVLVLATGGTIASTSDADGAKPSESGSDLIEAIPELEGRVYVREISQRPSVDMDFETLERVRDAIKSHRVSSDGGVVVLHGTDTMAESAFYLSLTSVDGPPVIFTGAQRRPDQHSADGPANLLGSVAAAEESALRRAGGTYVLLNGELHAARDAVKAHSWRLDAFESPSKGPVAEITPSGFERHRDLEPRSPYLPVSAPPTSRVAIVSMGIGVDGRPVRRAVEDGCDGIVLQATGLGNAPEPVADAVAEVLDDGVPVVVTTRCHAGKVAPVYGGGGGYTLQEHGAILAEDLPAQKARIKLLVALESVTDTENVREAFVTGA
jgi:L-asparaginase